MVRKMNKKMKTGFKSTTNKSLKNKTILITGGAGSIGFQLTKRILEYQVKSVRVFDINEHALFTLNHTLKNSKLRVLLGSILDKERLEMAGKDVDIIIHVAALKNIEITEFNPIETVETNINGTVNVIKMALNSEHNKACHKELISSINTYIKTEEIYSLPITFISEYHVLRDFIRFCEPL